MRVNWAGFPLFSMTGSCVVALRYLTLKRWCSALDHWRSWQSTSSCAFQSCLFHPRAPPRDFWGSLGSFGKKLETWGISTGRNGEVEDPMDS